MEEVRVRVPRMDAAALRMAAEVKQVPVAAVLRQAVSEYLARREADRAVPIIDATFAKHVDRLAALLAKTYVAAATSAWQGYLLAGDEGAAAEVMRRAVERARVDFRQQGVELGEATPEEYALADALAEMAPPE